MYRYRINYTHKETLYSSLHITARSAEEAKRIAQAASFDDIASIELLRPASKSERKEAIDEAPLPTPVPCPPLTLTPEKGSVTESERQKILAICTELLSIHEAYAVYDMLFEPEYDKDDVLAYIRWCAHRFDENKSTDFEEWVAETAIERTGAPHPKHKKED